MLQTQPHVRLTLLLLLLTFAAGRPILSDGGQRRRVLLVSLDGFRHDYLTMFANESAFLRRLASRGVHVKAMTPEFLTKTFPNHWTMVTGVHQEIHGIVSNDMYDPVYNATFTMKTMEARWWNESVPIWVTARQQGLKVASIFWPGGDAKHPGGGPDYMIPYGKNLSSSERVDTVVRWLTADGVDLCLMHFSEPDSSGHSFGPNSSEVALAISQVMLELKALIGQLDRNGVVDIIITSDHGMSELSNSRLFDFKGALDQFVDRYIDSGPHLSMFAKPGQRNRLVEFLQNETLARNLPIRVFAKEALPRRFHYSRHRRIPDVLVLPNQSYAVVQSGQGQLKGHHGFDNAYDEMKVPLIAFGPSFQRGQVVDGFRQVDVYGLMCHLLRIQPQPNNGSLALLPAMLSSSAGLASQSATAAVLAVAAALLGH